MEKFQIIKNESFKKTPFNKVWRLFLLGNVVSFLMFDRILEYFRGEYVDNKVKIGEARCHENIRYKVQMMRTHPLFEVVPSEEIQRRRKLQERDAVEDESVTPPVGY